jgi:hypothetical protein
LETELEEIDLFFAKPPPGRGPRSKTTAENDDVSDLGVGVLREMYVEYNTRVPAGAVSRHVISVCNRVVRDARVDPGAFHSVLVFLKLNWDLVPFLKTMSGFKDQDSVTGTV